MILNNTNTENLRYIFCNAVLKNFGDSTSFLDFIEEENYSTKYDCCVYRNDENYIINRETGEYVNWYKFNHIGRDIHISIMKTDKIDVSKWIDDFLVDFKKGGEKDE